jgi:hypothetical protein
LKEYSFIVISPNKACSIAPTSLDSFQKKFKLKMFPGCSSVEASNFGVNLFFQGGNYGPKDHGDMWQSSKAREYQYGDELGCRVGTVGGGDGRSG